MDLEGFSNAFQMCFQTVFMLGLNTEWEFDFYVLEIILVQPDFLSPPFTQACMGPWEESWT